MVEPVVLVGGAVELAGMQVGDGAAQVFDCERVVAAVHLHAFAHAARGSFTPFAGEGVAGGVQFEQAAVVPEQRPHRLGVAQFIFAVACRPHRSERGRCRHRRRRSTTFFVVRQCMTL